MKMKYYKNLMIFYIITKLKLGYQFFRFKDDSQ